MILLDATTRKLQIVLAGAKTSNDSPWVASYVDISQSTFGMTGASSATGASNGVTAVDVVAAPGATTTRQLKYFSLLNADTVAITATVRYNDNATIRNTVTFIMLVGEALTYNAESGWRVLDASGNFKQSLGGTTANLTDFATGSWTPADGSGAGLTFSSVSAQYIKIGTLVRATASLVFPVTANGAQVTLSGLPFLVGPNTSSRIPAMVFSNSTVPSAIIVADSSSAVAKIYTPTSGGFAASTNANFTSATIFACIDYRTV